MALGERFTKAVAMALDLHATERRKGTDVPYAAHLLSTASLVLQFGGTEDQAIAGLLHDAAEDACGQPTVDRRSRDHPRAATLGMTSHRRKVHLPAQSAATIGACGGSSPTPTSTGSRSSPHASHSRK